MSEAFYLNKLYPLQDKILQLFADNNIGHYLTGGTALSRAYLNHRYSDDLDFFLNNDPVFEKEADRAIALLQNNFQEINIDNRQLGFRRIFVNENDLQLKLDFVNDVEYHLNGFEKTNLYFKTDNPLNILSNKISALNRQSAKDIADIIEISRNYSFNWPNLIEDASKKDNWVNEIDVFTYIKTYEAEKLNSAIIWVKKPALTSILNYIKKICYDIVTGNDNSLYKR